MMSYSIDFRRQLLKVKSEEGLSISQVSDRFKVSPRSVCRWMNRLEPIIKRNKPSTKIDMKALSQDILDYPDLFQYERAEKFGVSKSCIFYALKRLKVTNKKNIISPQN